MYVARMPSLCAKFTNQHRILSYKSTHNCCGTVDRSYRLGLDLRAYNAYCNNDGYHTNICHY